MEVGVNKLDLLAFFSFLLGSTFSLSLKLVKLPQLSSRERKLGDFNFLYEFKCRPSLWPEGVEQVLSPGPGVSAPKLPKFLFWSPESPKLVLVFIHSFLLRSDFLLTSLTRPTMALPGVAAGAGVEVATVSPAASDGLRRENMLLLLLLLTLFQITPRHNAHVCSGSRPRGNCYCEAVRGAGTVIGAQPRHRGHRPLHCRARDTAAYMLHRRKHRNLQLLLCSIRVFVSCFCFWSSVLIV